MAQTQNKRNEMKRMVPRRDIRVLSLGSELSKVDGENSSAPCSESVKSLSLSLSRTACPVWNQHNIISPPIAMIGTMTMNFDLPRG